MRTCQCCGKTLPTDSRSTRKFCGSGCRTRYTRGHRPGVIAEVVDLTPDTATDLDSELTLEEIAAELRRTLHASSTPASSKAGLAKELRAVMAEIAKSKPTAVSLIDQLAERRAQRTGS